MTSIMVEYLSHFAQPGALFPAVIIDAVLGDPVWFYHQMPHPVVWIGKVIARADLAFNRDSQPPITRRRAGIAVIAVLTVAALLLGAALQMLLLALPWGPFGRAIALTGLISHNRLYTHVPAG